MKSYYNLSVISDFWRCDMEIHISKELRQFNRLFSETGYAYHEAAVKLGLSDSVMNIFYSLCAEGEPCPLQTVVRQSGASKQTINSAIRKLEGEDVLWLEPGRSRGKNVRLTEKGRALAERTVIPLMRMEDEIYASWSKEELRMYLELTGRFLTAFKEKIKRL